MTSLIFGDRSCKIGSILFCFGNENACFGGVKRIKMSSPPRWYGHLYPAAKSKTKKDGWPSLNGEMGNLLSELKTEIEKGEVPRGDSSKHIAEYAERVKQLVYRPTKQDANFRAHYARDRAHRMMPSSFASNWLGNPLVALTHTKEDEEIQKLYSQYNEKQWLPLDYYEKHWYHLRDAELHAAEAEFRGSVACEAFEPGYFVVRREEKDDAHPDGVKGFHYPTYGYFQSVTQFQAWLEALPVGHRMFHEMVMPERPQKLFFDIDAEQGKIDAATKVKESLLFDKKEARELIFSTFLEVLKATFKRVYNLELTADNIVICDSSNEKKFSRHVLVTGYHELNYQERKYFAMTVYYALVAKDKMVGSFLDSAPLKHPNASLRITGCHKWGQVGRTKKILSNHTFLDTIIQHILPTSVALPAFAPPASAYSGRVGGGFIEGKVSKCVEAAFRGLYDVDECERRGGNLFIYAGNANIVCPFCNVHHDNVNGLTAALQGKKIRAFCPRYDAHPDTRVEKKFMEIGKLDYPQWYIDAKEAFDWSSRAQSLAPTDLSNPVHIKEKELSPDLCLQQLEKCDTLLVRSPMGTAKTKSMINYCEKKDPETVVILGCRVGYDKGLATRYGKDKYINYLDVKEKSILLEKHKHLVVQIESLHRLIFRQGKDGKVVWPDLLILDEIEGLIQQFSHDTMRTSGTIHRCWEVFEALVKHAKKVVMMDAFLGARTAKLAKHMRKPATTISVINDYPAAENRHYSVIPKLKQIGIMQQFLRKSIPFVVCSNSLKFIKRVKKLLEKQVAEEKLPAKKIKDYTSETGQEMRKDLEDPDKAWADVDVLMYSPTITIGCSFEVSHFRSIFGYFVETSCGFLDCLQMLGRVRDCKFDPEDDAHLYYLSFSDHYMIYDEEPSVAWIESCLENTYMRALTNSHGKLLTGEEKLEQDARREETRQLIAVRLDGAERHIESDGKLSLVKDNYYYAQLSNVIEEIKSRNNFVYWFLLYLLDSGAQITLDGCSCIPSVARDMLDEANELVDTVEKKKAYEDLAEELLMDNSRDDEIIAAAKTGMLVADVEVKKEEATRLGEATSLTQGQLEDINLTQRGQMTQSVLNSVAKATLAKAYGLESSQVDVEFTEKYNDIKLRTTFKRLRDSTAEDSIAASIEKLKQKSGAIILANMSTNSSTCQLDCKDKSIRHELCEGLMKMMGFDLTSTKRWEKLVAPTYDAAIGGLKSGITGYIEHYRTALVREIGKKSSSLLNSDQWDEKRLREFAQGMVLSTYGVKVQLNAEKGVSVSLDENKAPFHWDGERYETDHRPMKK